MSPEAAPLLRIEGLVKRFGAFHALDGLNFNLQAGEILGLVGPNGSGKTTCINVISGLYAPEEGKVLIQVSYRVRATNSRFNLVYPFYLDEGSTR